MLAMADLRKQAAADLKNELMAQEAAIAKMKNTLADEEEQNQATEQPVPR